MSAFARIVGVIVGIFPAPYLVQASEEHIHLYHADAQHNDWMRSLIRPDTQTSCCNLNDCSPTDAEWRDEQWWAVVRGQWRAIPPEKVLSHPLSIDGEAWVCASQATIYCFVPPIPGY